MSYKRQIQLARKPCLTQHFLQIMPLISQKYETAFLQVPLVNNFLIDLPLFEFTFMFGIYVKFKKKKIIIGNNHQP